MTRRRPGIAAIALGSVVALTAAGCGGGSSTSASDSSTGAGAATAGGTLHYLTKRPAEHLDPHEEARRLRRWAGRLEAIDLDPLTDPTDASGRQRGETS